MNGKLTLLVSAVVCMTLSEGVKSKTLTEILQDYCVPTSGNYCTERAIYKNGKCECEALDKYYEASSRSCKNCVTGSFVKDDRKSCEPIVCPDGYVATLITDGKCPSGYSLTQVKSGACPSGYGLKEYVATSKSWK